MKRLFSCFLLAIATVLVFTQCDDTTDSIGSSVVPENDKITARTDTLFANSRTIMANDSILASSSDVYLGQYTDSESGTTFVSSFVTQFSCAKDFEFPEEGVIGDSASYTKLRLYFNEYYGDSLNAMRCEIYELDNTLEEGTPYYTNLDPEEFYDVEKAPLATKTFNTIDFNLHDTILNSEDYTRHIEIALPNSIGNRFISKFYETDAEGKNTGKAHFANSEAFINDVFKGVYVKCTHGDGTVLRIYRTRLDVGFKRYIASSSGEKDSIQALSAPFYSGKEVLQANKFDNNDLKPLVDEKEHTYIKTPAGLFTEVQLPIVELVEGSDDINSAKMSFTRYNEESGFATKAHSNLLMIRKSELYSFFLKNKLTDGKTSFLTTFDNSTNEYTYANIANLFKNCYDEYIKSGLSLSEWEAKHPDWDKVVLIPVATTEDSNGNVVKIVHDISISSMRLRGGTEYRIPIEVVTSKFNK
ncbi:MAG: DUF4270 domain-containing protein [Bacteroidales bacterium]|nr:DUF4270 domain-containing protein [Bacteroidales bacterium]